jgi:uncharacterized protein (DUF1499 family)
MPESLPPCPKSPNCVSTQAEPGDAVHYIEPLELSGDPAEALDRLKRIVGAMPRVELVDESADHLDFLFTTRLFRWKDDLRFVLDAERGVIDFRSASRTGYGDLGVNRKRMESIRRAWQR